MFALFGMLLFLVALLWSMSWLECALFAFIVAFGVHVYLTQQQPRDNVQSAPERTHAEKKASKRLRKPACPSEITRTPISASSLPPFHPYFQISMIPYAMAANRRNRLLSLPAELRNKVIFVLIVISAPTDTKIDLRLRIIHRPRTAC